MSAKRDTGVVRTGIDKLTTWMRLAPSSRRSVQDALKYLREDFGLLEIVRKEAPGAPRRYRITVGWADGEEEEESSADSPEDKIEPSKATAIKRAYREARMLRHDTTQIAPIRAATMAKLVRLIEDLRTGEDKSFADVADDLMALYMRLPGRADRALISRKHPAEWIGWYFAELESGLRRKYRKERKEPQSADEGGKVADDPPRLNREQTLAALEAVKLNLKKASG